MLLHRYTVFPTLQPHIPSSRSPTAPPPPHPQPLPATFPLQPLGVTDRAGSRDARWAGLSPGARAAGAGGRRETPEGLEEVHGSRWGGSALLRLEHHLHRLGYGQAAGRRRPPGGSASAVGRREAPESSAAGSYPGLQALAGRRVGGVFPGGGRGCRACSRGDAVGGGRGE
jgi:hypothetical protein